MWNTFSSRWPRPGSTFCGGHMVGRSSVVWLESRTKRTEKVFGQIKPDAECGTLQTYMPDSRDFHVSHGLAFILLTAWPPPSLEHSFAWMTNPLNKCLALMFRKSPNPERLAYILYSLTWQAQSVTTSMLSSFIKSPLNGSEIGIWMYMVWLTPLDLPSGYD